MSISEILFFLTGLLSGGMIVLTILNAKDRLKHSVKPHQTGTYWEERYREECYKTRDLTTAFEAERAENESLRADVQQLVNCLSDGKRRIRIIPRPVHRLRREKFNPDHYNFNDEIVFRPGHEG